VIYRNRPKYRWGDESCARGPHQAEDPERLRFFVAVLYPEASAGVLGDRHQPGNIAPKTCATIRQGFSDLRPLGVSGDGKRRTSRNQVRRAKTININARTPYQAFWLMVTAEPDFAVVDPSPQVVLYSIDEEARKVGTRKKSRTKKQTCRSPPTTPIMIRLQLPWRLRQANCCRQERPWNWRPGQAS